MVLGAYDGAGIAGMVGFKAQTGARHAQKGFVGGYVAPRARGRGVGRALMDGIVAAATGRVEQLTLSVVRTNAAALALYAQCGFTAYGLQPRALKSAQGYADEVRMVRFLPV
ncbi:GNAT family N-acetyltransferase [Ralstonia mannitolilytica]|uniref:GNAT family N-acetyltransferase n=1 Tax=Ralstonia mannitolilytica TaxID=105219 RepID=UPI001F253B21|nr:GNAT family N-acetyltransferase [Ralstonia mannitolilytica]